MRSETLKVIDNFGSLGKEVKISPKSYVSINRIGYKKEYMVESVECLIGIGHNHTATLIMSKEAWEALNQGDEVCVTTLKEFKEKFL